MLKRVLCALLCIIMLSILVACNNNEKNNNQESQTCEPTIESTDKIEEDDEKDFTDDTISTEPSVEATKPEKPSKDPQLQIYEDEYGKIKGFEGKIEKLIIDDWDLTFYADGGIYHQIEDDDDNPVLHCFNIGEVNQILYYASPNHFIAKHITPEMCVYTRPNDSQVYVSITAESCDYSKSDALTFSVNIDPENILCAYRDTYEVFLIYSDENNVKCYHYDLRDNKLIGNEIVVGKINDETVALKLIATDGFGSVVITKDDICYHVKGGEVKEWQGEYYVELYEKYRFYNAQSMLDPGINYIYIADNDKNNLHTAMFVYDKEDEMINIKIKMPDNATVDDIVKHWGLDERCVIQLKNGKYYLIDEIDSFETNEYVEMVPLNIDQSLDVSGFVFVDWNLLVLSNGHLYKIPN